MLLYKRKSKKREDVLWEKLTIEHLMESFYDHAMNEIRHVFFDGT